MNDPISIDKAKSFFISGLQKLNNQNIAGAEIDFEASLVHVPDRLSTLINLTIVLIKLKKFEKAEGLIYEGLTYHPKNKDLLMALVDIYKILISNSPDYAEAYSNLGNAYKELNMFDEALAAYSNALRLNPNLAEVYSNRGFTLNEIGRYEDAIIDLDKSLKLNPLNKVAFYNRGVVLRNLNLLDEAISDYNNALEIEYNFPEVQFNKSLILLSNQQFKEGWKLYKEWRWKTNIDFSTKLQTIIPAWDTGFIEKTTKLLLWAEQGLGDEIFYFGIFKNYVDIDGAITLTADKRLLNLFERSLPVVDFIESKQIFISTDKNSYDYQLPIGDMPHMFSVHKYMNHKLSQPFLKINDERIENLKANNRFLSDKFICGLSWKSSSKENGVSKSIDLNDLSPLFAIKNIEFISLQYDSTKEEIDLIRKNFGVNIHVIDDLDIYNDIDGLTALISICNLVVTTSNITAHLTGSIGKKGMVLLPFSKGKIWYWHSGEGKSLWYPSLELVSQTKMNDWTDPIYRCKEWVLEQM